MNVDLDSLRCFEAAAVYLNFRAAARAVALSPSAFGERVSLLEARLGARLFDRTTRRVILTEAGRKLLPHARRCLAEAERCEVAVRPDAAAPPFSLTVGSRFELGMSWLVPALGALAASRPERTLHVQFGDTPALMQALTRGTVDAKVSSARLTSGQVDTLTLHREDYAWVARPDVLEARPLHRAEDAERHTLLDISPDLPLFRYFLDALAEPRVWRFGAVGWLGGIAAIRHRVLEGAGVAVLPGYFVKADIDAGRLVVVLPEVPLKSDAFRMVWIRDHPLQDEIVALAGELRARPLA